ncbi:MAG TPA: antitoxin family protein [bacterium]|nr:antitoxin family protein [bacterium]HQO35850.1 antitoxin family protein [bacterium]HQP98546.1 antitoxin family protein [bacterium]
MSKTIQAIFDGEVLRPQDPVALEPNTRVRITIESVESSASRQTSFLRTARSLNLDGPSDWAVNLHTYLYGEESRNNG